MVVSQHERRPFSRSKIRSGARGFSTFVLSRGGFFPIFLVVSELGVRIHSEDLSLGPKEKREGRGGGFDYPHPESKRGTNGLAKTEGKGPHLYNYAGGISYRFIGFHRGGVKPKNRRNKHCRRCLKK